MSNLSLPYNIIQDQQNQIKASSVHVQGNFDALTSAVNNRLDLDGSNAPTADISMGSHKLTNVATPTVSGDAATKGYVDSELNAYSARNLTFTGTVNATTQATSDNSTKVATTAFVIDILKTIYPVGSVYIGTQNSCPMAALFGTWALVSSDKALWTGDGTNGNTTIAAGLPALTGALNGIAGHDGNVTGTGAVSASRVSGLSYTGGGDAAYNIAKYNVSVNGAGSSTIYGNSTTVQPPAYVVNVWRRTA
ncbi:MAG: hypothetical protein II238_00670 [Alphaproteobacteria bacterium]|nr:hypothetical protein [Alphaproteobacteria bacterium]